MCVHLNSSLLIVSYLPQLQDDSYSTLIIQLFFYRQTVQSFCCIFQKLKMSLHSHLQVMPVYWPLKSSTLTFKKGVVVKCKCGFSTEQLRTRGCALCITFCLLLIGALLVVIRFRLLTDGFFFPVNSHLTFPPVKWWWTFTDNQWHLLVRPNNPQCEIQTQGSSSNIYLGGRNKCRFKSITLNIL